MPWIKRNLFFVVNIAIAIVLMGVAGWLVFSKMQEDSAIQEELNQQVSEAQRLYDAPAFPSDQNIEEAKQQQQALKAFREQLKGVFTPAPTFPKLDDRGFFNYLEKTIAELTVSASNANVFLPQGPPRFSFTFTSHRALSQFDTNAIEPWLFQLADIKAICGVLYQARVNALDNIKRVPVSERQDGGGDEFLSDTIVTNNAGTTFAPYMVSFRSFGPELANALEGFSRSTNCIIVKAVNVVPSTVELPVMVTPTPSGTQLRRRVLPYQPAATPRPQAAEPDFARYGAVARPSTPAPTYNPVPRAAAAAAPTTETVLKEQPLQVTLLLEVVRLGRSQ